LTKEETDLVINHLEKNSVEKDLKLNNLIEKIKNKSENTDKIVEK